MSDPGPPEYNVYRSGRGLRERLLPSGGEPDGLRELRKLREHGGGDDEGGSRERRGVPWKRILKIVVAVCAAWILLSVVLFFISAQTSESASARAKSALDGGGSMFTGSTILVLGSDARPKGTKEPGAGGPSRSDSIMLMHVGFGTVRKLSIPRDSLLGDGATKINAAYAGGGAAAAIRTVREFIGHGLKINHVIEVNFTEFPKLIDSLGGIDVKLKRCIASPPFGGRPFKLRAGEHHLDGRQALGFARVRKNRCSPGEDDRDRAKRQQQVLAEIRSRALSPATFLRLSWVAWQAPRTIRTDLRGLGLSALFTDLLTGGTGKTHVLRGVNQGSGVFVPEDEKAAAVRLLEGK